MIKRILIAVAGAVLGLSSAQAQSWPDGHGSISNADIASFMGKNTRCGYFDSDGKGRASTLTVNLFFSDDFQINGTQTDLMIYRWKWGGNTEIQYVDLSGYRRGGLYGTKMGTDKRYRDDVTEPQDYWREAKISDDGIVSIHAGIVWDSGAEGNATLICQPFSNGRPLWAYGTERFGIDQR